MNESTETLDYYYWISSDWAYFGNPRLRALAQRHGLQIRYRPVDLVSVYARTGGIQLQHRSRERKAYRLVEMARFRDLLGMPINLEPRHMVKTGQLPSLFAIAADRMGIDIHDLNHAIMRALWAEDRDIEDPAELARIASACGLDGEAILERARVEDIHAAYLAYTDEAVGRGVWGAPFYFFRGEPFWGQDRLDMLAGTVARALRPG